MMEVKGMRNAKRKGKRMRIKFKRKKRAIKIDNSSLTMRRKGHRSKKTNNRIKRIRRTILREGQITQSMIKTSWWRKRPRFRGMNLQLKSFKMIVG